jgi:hypothetical protein
MAFATQGRSSAAAPFSNIDVLWITAGLGCDGDTIAMTGATQPSIEDILLGSMPWIPAVRLHNPFLAYENGDEFLGPFHLAAEGKLKPFILVVEGSIPNENNKKEAEVHLGRDDAGVFLRVRDYGQGMPRELVDNFQRKRAEAGVGLAGMRERVSELGGRLEIFSDGQGTVVSVHVPVVSREREI